MASLAKWIQARDAQLRDAMQSELEAMIIEGKTYHQNAVRNWKKKPKWRVHSTSSKTVLGAQLEVIGDMREIWVWVDEGTGRFGESGSPYWIFPRNPGGRLRFQSGYNAKTRPVAKANVGDGSRSGGWVNSEGVLHPGIKGRKFSETYRERVLKPTIRPRIVKRVRQT